jgi:hypothetical protein
VTNGVDPPDLVQAFRRERAVPSEQQLRSLVSRFARVGSQLENATVELKERFDDDGEAWLNLQRQLVAFGNSGGGIIIFGLSSSGARVGLVNSLAGKFDPVNIGQKLQRHAPQARVPTAYAEVVQYGKRYGILLIGRSNALVVFDKVGNAVGAGGRTKAVFQQGVLYVRGEGTSREARQADVDALINERVENGLSAFLARIETVAHLPSSSELLARNQGADKAYVLVPGGQGVPVTITQDVTAPAVQLAEVLSPEVPLSTLDAEIVGQLRQWHTDAFHRVPRATLMRWYLGRATFTPITERAEFCFLSAIHDWGYPMYWASQMDRLRLEAVLTEQVESRAYPDNQAAVFVVGAFFFSRREELLDRFSGYLTANSSQIVQRLRDAVDPLEYLTSGRICAARVRLQGQEHLLSDLMSDRETTAATLFEDLMGYHGQGNVPPESRQAAHQLDMLVHGDPAS